MKAFYPMQFPIYGNPLAYHHFIPYGFQEHAVPLLLKDTGYSKRHRATYQTQRRGKHGHGRSTNVYTSQDVRRSMSENYPMSAPRRQSSSFNVPRTRASVDHGATRHYSGNHARHSLATMNDHSTMEAHGGTQCPADAALSPLSPPVKPWLRSIESMADNVDIEHLRSKSSTPSLDRSHYVLYLCDDT